MIGDHFPVGFNLRIDLPQSSHLFHMLSFEDTNIESGHGTVETSIDPCVGGKIMVVLLQKTLQFSQVPFKPENIFIKKQSGQTVV